jgi:hypothetical protein
MWVGNLLAGIPWPMFIVRGSHPTLLNRTIVGGLDQFTKVIFKHATILCANHII